jgi:hypothetical protein
MCNVIMLRTLLASRGGVFLDEFIDQIVNCLVLNNEKILCRFHKFLVLIFVLNQFNAIPTLHRSANTLYQGQR